MLYNVSHLNIYGYNLLNKWDVSRRLNQIQDYTIARYYYNGKNKVWFIHQNYIFLILKKSR